MCNGRGCRCGRHFKFFFHFQKNFFFAGRRSASYVAVYLKNISFFTVMHSFQLFNYVNASDIASDIASAMQMMQPATNQMRPETTATGPHAQPQLQPKLVPVVIVIPEMRISQQTGAEFLSTSWDIHASDFDDSDVKSNVNRLGVRVQSNRENRLNVGVQTDLQNSFLSGMEIILLIHLSFSPFILHIHSTSLFKVGIKDGELNILVNFQN